jgi:hypothetical protein
MSKELEQAANQEFPEELPASVAHHLPEEENQLERVEFSEEKVLDFIRQVQESPSYYTSHFELDLEKVGLLPGLEETGVLPPKKSVTEIEPSTLDVEPHPEQLVGERQKALKNLYIGTVLANLFEELFSRK